MDTDAKKWMGDPISTTQFKQVYNEYELRTKQDEHYCLYENLTQIEFSIITHFSFHLDLL